MILFFNAFNSLNLFIVVELWCKKRKRTLKKNVLTDLIKKEKYIIYSKKINLLISKSNIST